MNITRAAVAAAIGLLMATNTVRADGSGDPKPASSDDGKYVDANGFPTFSIKNGKVDWYTYIGYQRYAANCLQCHGPDALGSSYAPSLVDSLSRLSYSDFMATVAGGKQDVTSAQTLVMPALGTNKNVMCFIDAIYVYLRARSDGALDRQRPEDHEGKPASWTTNVDSCMG
jgi:methanol metabolism-related c-type cytochrome